MRVKFIYEHLKAGLSVQDINEDYAPTPEQQAQGKNVGFHINMEEAEEIIKFGDTYPEKL